MGNATKIYGYQIVRSCTLRPLTHTQQKNDVFPVGLWGGDVTRDAFGATREFTFSADGKDAVYTLTATNPGVYLISDADRQSIVELLRHTQLFTVSFLNFLGVEISVEFQPDGIDAALTAIQPACPKK